MKCHIKIGDSYQLDLDGALMVGGIGMVVDNAAIPSSLWSATLRHGYVGCMRDLVVNGNAVDLAAFARQQDSGNVKSKNRSVHFCYIFVVFGTFDC